jgi:hypothetical protein
VCQLFDAVERGGEAAGEPTQDEDLSVQLGAGVAATGVAKGVAGAPVVGFMMVVIVDRYVHTCTP